MEEKGILENIISITEKLFSGITSFGKKDLSEQLESLADTLKQVAKEKSKLTEDESEALLKIFTASARPDFSKDFMNKIDKEVFYDFGRYLDDQLANPGKNLKFISHEYLNLFRFPVFLRKIYGEKKWEKLTHDLILKSSYNTRVLFNQRLRDYENKTLFKIIKGNSVKEYGWKKSAELTGIYRRAVHKLIKNKGNSVAFLLDNCLEMALLDIACLTGNIVNVMIPANSVNEHIKFILHETGSSLLIVQDEKQLSKIKSIKSDLPELEKIILLEGSSAEEWVINFSDFTKLGKESVSDDGDGQSDNTDMTSLATIMYTSGTTGEPKGIMFSQMNIIYKRFCRAMAIPEIGDGDRFLCFLPLYHTFGRYLEMMGSIFWAAEYCFLENPSVEVMISNMQLVKPSVFISIPKKWIQLYEYITSKVDIELDDEEKIKNEIEKATGGCLKWGLSAAGYLPSDIFQFFQNYGIELMSGFGMTEATGGITMTPPNKYIPNSLGKALPGIEIKLGDDGEILIKGPYVMLGYFNTDNSETFIEDGWLPSGDVMKMDEDGFIEIIDRKKEIYKNIKGETIAPQKIENLFRDFENVKQVFLAGDHRQFNTVLIHPDYDDEDSPLHNMDEKQKQEYFSSVIVTVNKFLAPFERILDFRLIDRPFSDKYGELTPKGTYKRKIIEMNFSELIESMYVKNHTTLYVKNTEVRVPNWFLREKGSLSRDILSDEEKIIFPKLKLSLTIKRTDEQNVLQIGSYNYTVTAPYIDLQLLLTDPVLWIGNRELTDFTGNSIIQWYRRVESFQIKFHSLAIAANLEENEKQQFQKIISSSEISLRGIHLAYMMLLTDEQEQSKNAIEYYNKLLEDVKNTYHKLILNLLSRPNITGKVKNKRELFTTAIQKADDKIFEDIFERFLKDDPLLLNSGIIQSIVESIRSERKLKFIEDFIKTEMEKTWDISSTSLQDMFELITAYGIRHPVDYRRVRRFLMRIALLTSDTVLKDLVEKNLLTLREGFREWLGPNQKIAIDVETNEEYGWEDVLTFEEGIDSDDRFRLKNAIIKTPVLREAIFMFSGGLQLRLDNILPGGIWISLLESKIEKSIYRLTVQTRYQGAFDITIHLNKNLPPAIVREEIKWLILAGTNLKGERLLPFFGGYWEEYELWTEVFVPRDSVAKYLERETKRKESGYQQRLFELWPHFVWNAAAAYMNFWKLTNYQVELANPMPENVTVPTHDYQTGTLLYSVSKRIKSTSVFTFFTNFYNLFVVNTVKKYPLLEKKSIWNYIFSGITECEGETKSVELFLKFVEELKSDNDHPDKSLIINKANEFITSVRKDGFIPRSLFFAIKRFHRWHLLNQYADMNAQAEMLYELYETYQLFELEKEHPSTRTIFFLRTAFKNSSENLKEGLNTIAKKQAANEITNEDAQKHYSLLHLLPGLNNAEIFFLARLSYPHLKPKDTAAMLKAESFGSDESNLVVQLADEEGNPFTIRSPISPKEISRLQALFLESNLMVHFSPEHRFLVALSDRGFIIGGLFYKRADEQTAHMEKIVVSSRYRRKGISEALMRELLNRLRSEHFKFITTGFFRPEYFYRFGFRIEKKYSGLVADLSTLSNKI